MREKLSPVDNEQESSLDAPGKIVRPDFSLEREKGVLIAGSKEQLLTDREARVLEFFCMNPGKIFSADDVYRSVWGEEPFRSRVVVTHISNVRRKLKALGLTDCVRTVWGAGYFIVDPVDLRS